MNSNISRNSHKLRNLGICNYAGVLSIVVTNRGAAAEAEFHGRGIPFHSAEHCGGSGLNLAAPCAALSC
jgi:hypothetical protein